MPAASAMATTKDGLANSGAGTVATIVRRNPREGNGYLEPANSSNSAA